jgi:O2-independent ubiquinone biosynthesis protein UbiV
MAMTTQLSLGPILYQWSEKKRRDFYFQIADEAPIDIVYLGEIICFKRLSTWASLLPSVIERLQSAGKTVIYSTPILVRNEKELDAMNVAIADSALMVEANDASALNALSGKPHCLGPYINIYNELTLAAHAKQGAVRATLPPELPKTAIEILTKTREMAIEMQVFGRLGLAISARCPHARAYHSQRRGCRHICEKDPDGLDVLTLDKKPFLAINGLQTLSYTYCNLLKELEELKNMSVNTFRLSPHDVDMLAVAHLFRQVLDGGDPQENYQKLQALMPDVSFSNGYYHQVPGHQMTQED